MAPRVSCVIARMFWEVAYCCCAVAKVFCSFCMVARMFREVASCCYGVLNGCMSVLCGC